MLEVLSGILFCSLAGNGILAWHLFTKRKGASETYDAQALLTDLLHGSALIRVERVAPADVLIRSPRGRK